MSKPLPENELRMLLRAVADQADATATRPDRAVRHAKRRLARNLIAGALSLSLVAYGAIALSSRLTETKKVPPAGSDGRYGNPQIWTMDADGSDARQLPGPRGENFEPVWSSDGNRIAFVNRINGATNIWVMDADGSNRRRVTNAPENEYSPSFSADGRRLAFHRDLDNPERAIIYTVNLDGSDEKQIAEGNGPHYSPDGGRLVFACDDENGASRVCLMNADGSGEVRMLDTNGPAYLPRWVGEKTVAYFDRPHESPGGGMLRVIDTEGSASIRDLAEGPHDEQRAGPGMGGSILFTKSASLFTTRPGSDTANRVTTNPTVHDHYPSWNARAGRIVLMRVVDPPTQIYSMNADGSNVQRLTNFPGVNGGAAMSPDGNYIAFASTKDGFAAIYRMSSDGSELKRLTNDREGAIRPVWSPDGTSIAFQRIGLSSDAPTGIWAMAMDGTAWRSLDTPHSPQGRGPCWRPDGQAVIFEADGVIYEGELLTGRETRIGQGSWPACSTDMGRYFIAGNSSILRLSKNRTGGGLSTTRATGLRRPPMALWWNGDNERDVLWSDGDDIWALDPNLGGGVRRITSGPPHDYNPSWTPDGRILFNSDR